MQSPTVDQWHFLRDGVAQTFHPPSDSIAAWIEACAARHPDKEAVVSVSDGSADGTAIAYARLAHLLHQSADFFTNTLGLRGGDTVGVLMQNVPELLAISWAAWSIGLRTVPLDSRREASL